MWPLIRHWPHTGCKPGCRHIHCSTNTVLIMQHNIIHISLLVNDYDEALEFYLGKLGFELLEDTPLDDHGKRWVVIAPKHSQGVTLVLARVSDSQQQAQVGNQCGGRVMLFLSSDDVQRDYEQWTSAGVTFVQPPVVLPHGTVAIFEDLYGNRWDLIQMSEGHSLKSRFSE